MFYKVSVFLYDYLKKSLSIFLFGLIKFIKPTSKYVGARKLKKYFKRSEMMFVLATGKSINSYSFKDFKRIGKADSVGINFFILHDFIPTFYLIEPHPNNLNYFSILSQSKFSNASVLYKGYGSLTKLSNIVRNVNSVPGNLKNFMVAKDAYQKGVWSSVPIWLRDNILKHSHSDFLYNNTGSILYAVFMSYKMGYKSVILCGFDMSDQYFYCDANSKLNQIAKQCGLCLATSANTIHNDEDRVEIIISVLTDMNNKFKMERGGGVFMYSNDGVLSEHLPIFEEKH